MRGQEPMTGILLSLVEPDVRISRIRLSPESSLPVSIHKGLRPTACKRAAKLSPGRARHGRWLRLAKCLPSR